MVHNNVIWFYSKFHNPSSSERILKTRYFLAELQLVKPSTFLGHSVEWVICDFRSLDLNMIMCKYYFTNKVADHWNSLPNWVVTANNNNLFQKTWSIPATSRYNDFWAQIEWTGSSSKVFIVLTVYSVTSSWFMKHLEHHNVLSHWQHGFR